MLSATPWQLFLLACVWGFYCAFHSLTATTRVKTWAMAHWPGLMPVYRLAYNAFALVTLVPPFWLMGRWGGDVLWRWEGWTAYVSLGVALLTGAGFLSTFRGYDLMELLGLRQFRLGIRTVSDQERFKLTLLHRFVRHPWYSLALAFIYTRDMDSAFLVSTLCWTLYFVVGSRLEESRLIELHGETYRRYRASVPGLIPSPWRFLSSGALRELEVLESEKAGDIGQF